MDNYADVEFDEIALANIRNLLEQEKLEDSLCIVMVVKKFFGIDICVEEAEGIWGEVSKEMYCAGWLILPERDEDIAKDIFDYIKYRSSSWCGILHNRIPYLDDEFVTQI